MVEGFFVIAGYSVQKVKTIMMLFGIKYCRKRKQDFLTHNVVLYLAEFLCLGGGAIRRALIEIQVF